MFDFGQKIITSQTFAISSVLVGLLAISQFHFQFCLWLEFYEKQKKKYYDIF